MVVLSAKESGYHFDVVHTVPEQLEDFSIEELAKDMEKLAPLMLNLQRKVMVMSIMMRSMNQRSNTLQSLMGMFLQSTHSPQKVIETLERIGVSVSVNAIFAATHSLSAQTHRTLRSLGQSLLAAYAYDNFDVDLKSHEHKIENWNESLKHLTSGLMFPLQHCTSQEDLKCSEELWLKSSLNLRAEFKDRLREPELVEGIPVVKTPTIAALAMDVSNSTVAGNIQSVINLLKQGGITEPNTFDDPEIPDISEYVVLFHGDLGTGERLQAVQQRCAIENTPWDRFQHVVFVPADSIWRTFLQPSAVRLDETSLMRDVGVLRPKETGLYGTKPGFRVEAQKRDTNCTDLEAFAASEPSYEELQKMADSLARHYSAAERDQQHENGLLLNKYVLLYEELSYAMNFGDIGRLKTCLVTWILMFKATGKHKYANVMSEFLCNVHFVYPEGLKRAVRYHILINPTGKKGKFRGVDWCVELNNLFTKVINGGKGSNRTVARIILESPLVQIYHNLHGNFQSNSLHDNLSAQHGESNMAKTFQALCTYMAGHSANEVKHGRKSHHRVPDLLAKGQELMSAGDGADTEDRAEEGAMDCRIMGRRMGDGCHSTRQESQGRNENTRVSGVSVADAIMNGT
ncbi:hypothetical protein EV424DRAFT_1474635 [Suillus variegatus]|nr:hypothetical protein EV424DRAFT_1474635 [Suillus variegatus]